MLVGLHRLCPFFLLSRYCDRSRDVNEPAKFIYNKYSVFEMIHVTRFDIYDCYEFIFTNGYGEILRCGGGMFRVYPVFD